MIKRYFVFILVCLSVLQNSYADSYKTISYIQEMSEVLYNTDQDTLVVFDVDNVISTPADLIGRPKARAIRRAIFKEYEQKYGRERIEHIHALYMMKGNGGLVEPNIKEIIAELQQRKIPTIALTAMGAKKWGNIDDLMEWRIFRLKQKGISFAFKNLKKRILWDDEAGYESGIIFSGKQSKGVTLQYFLENIAYYQPKHIIFIDDNTKHLNSVSEMCNRLKIKFTGFHYKAAVFDQDQELSPEIARLQIKALDEKEIWISDSEARKIIEEERK